MSGRVGSGQFDQMKMSGRTDILGLVRFCTSIPGSGRVRINPAFPRTRVGFGFGFGSVSLSLEHGSGWVRVSLAFLETRVGSGFG